MSRHENIPRFYVSPLSAGEVSLPADEARHALKVLRLRVGSEVEVFDGRGGWAVGEISRAGRSDVAVQVEQVHQAEPLRTRVHVAFAVPKGKRLDWLLEKATELAAAALQPIRFERSVAGGEELSDATRDRWWSHCIAAAKQSGLAWLPALHDPTPLSVFLRQNTEALCLVGDITPDASSLKDVLSNRQPPPEDVILLIGPEGGFTPAEQDAIRTAGYRPVRLGATTLRIETAAAALLAGVRTVLG
ncbi:MAG: 16S rRNA (uracil(1498)-N(3))-methyltransferase [Phycisphaerae bacterium]|nr:16S rRNA (uracil(1498)-N(3))-methyltransferase [Phycisphaerae bacterium]